MGRTIPTRMTPGTARVAVAMLACCLALGGATAQGPLSAPPPAAPSATPDGAQVVLTLSADGRVFVGTENTADDDIEDKLLGIVNRDERIYLRADKRNRYDRVMDVLGILRRSGFTKVALVSWDGR